MSATLSTPKTTSGGEIIRELVNSTDGAGLHFDGAAGSIDIATPPDLGTKFSFEFIVQADSWADSVNKYIVDFGNGGRIVLGTDSAAGAKLAIYDNSSWKTFGVSPVDDLKVHHLIVTIDGTSAILYDNGNQIGTTTISSSHNIDGCADAAIGSNYGNTGARFNGTIYRARFWNKTLTAAEVTASYENATVPTIDRYGKEVYTSDFSSGVDNWSGFSATSSGNNDSISDGTTSKNDCLKTYAQAASSTHGITQTFGTLLAGTVTVKLDYLIPGPSFAGTGGGNTKVDGFKLENTTTSTVVRTESTLDVWTTIEFTATSAGGDAFKIFMLDGAADSFAGANDANDDRIFFKNIEVNNRGCVSDYDLAFANPTQSLLVQDRAGAADGTSSATGVTQVTKIEAVNTNKLNVGGTTPLVGIGLPAGSTPSEALHIYGSGPIQAEIESNTDNAALVINSNSEGAGRERSEVIFQDNSAAKWTVGLQENSYFKIIDAARGGSSLTIQDNSNMLLMENGGNVGVGTSSPASLISGGSSPILSIGGTDGGLVTGEKAGSLSFITSDASYTGTYSDGITGEIASVAESATGAAYGLAFYTGTISGSNRAERLRISNSGLATFSAGIAFSGQTDAAGMTATTLNHYEEGTWTPVIGGGSCTNLVGKYTKVGNKVTVTVSVLSGALTSATTNQITNLPFTCGSTRSATSAVAFYNCMGNASPVGIVIEGATRIDFVYNVASGAWATANFVNSTGNALHFSATYFV